MPIGGGRGAGIEWRAGQWTVTQKGSHSGGALVNMLCVAGIQQRRGVREPPSTRTLAVKMEGKGIINSQVVHILPARRSAAILLFGRIAVTLEKLQNWPLWTDG